MNILRTGRRAVEAGVISSPVSQLLRGQIVRRQSGAGRSAFTLMELLVVIGIIALLAGLLLPVLAQGRDKARRARCLSNQKQLGMAFQMYLEDQKEQFPAPGSALLYGPMREDWIHWQVGRSLANSALAPYLGDSVVIGGLARCPTDAHFAQLAYTQFTNLNAYGFSYAMTALRLTNDANAGLALALNAVTRERIPFSLSRVRNPSGKMLLVEEDRATLNDARWMPDHNPISRRHGGRSNVAFVDGHVESVLPAFARNPANFLPEF